MLEEVKDPRNKSYVTYESQVVLFTRILSAIFHISSMRKMTETFNSDICIQNIANTLEIEHLKELPHWSTINDYLEKLEYTELERIIDSLVKRLIRMRSFEDSRIRGMYWQIVVDGTNLYTSTKRHCSKDLIKNHKDKDGNVAWSEYYHSVLEAKLVLNGKIVVSIATEFIENDDPHASKQDCELKAFYRLAEKLKKRFPKLPICLGMDSLYACGPVFDLCNQYNWRYIIRFKEGSIPSVAEEFNALLPLEPSHTFSVKSNDIERTYKYVIDIDYQSHKLNIVECVQSDQPYPFTFITDLPINNRIMQVILIVEDGRRRWKIENEGFNNQKNHGYDLEHMFSKNYNAMKCHYLLIQIAHMISQIFENVRDIWKQAKPTCHSVADKTLASFRSTIFSLEDANVVKRRRIYHLF